MFNELPPTGGTPPPPSCTSRSSCRSSPRRTSITSKSAINSFSTSPHRLGRAARAVRPSRQKSREPWTWAWAFCSRTRCPVRVARPTRLPRVSGSNQASKVSGPSGRSYPAGSTRSASSRPSKSRACSRSGLGGPTYDQNLNRACLCDSSWPVGLGPGERQQAEFHGPDCSQKRCPSGDDPMTERDETNCTGVVAAGGRGTGK